MPEELWMEVCDIVQEAVIKTIPQKKKCKKAKWLSEEALQIAEKRRKGERQRKKAKIYPPECKVPNIARRDILRRDFQSECKEIKENKRMGENRHFFKKIRETKGIFHAKMGTIKDRNGMDLTEAEDIKKR